MLEWLYCAIIFFFFSIWKSSLRVRKRSSKWYTFVNIRHRWVHPLFYLMLENNGVLLSRLSFETIKTNGLILRKWFAGSTALLLENCEANSVSRTELNANWLVSRLNWLNSASLGTMLGKNVMVSGQLIELHWRDLKLSLDGNEVIWSWRQKKGKM